MMGMLDFGQITTWALNILQVALGLGAVIFVHELGHFAVAKLCGVKCEKFFVGFDIGGYKLSRRWGETEYGIGILPLGGYVKMLGQDDNPANISEQVRESRAASEMDAKEIVGPNGETYLVDRRSYLAKTVPQRMAIISAGVVMNVIFAFVFAVIAYGLGVSYNPCHVADVSAGAPAWQADIQPGDEIVKINDVDNPSFNELRGGVTLADMEEGVRFVVKRGNKEIVKVVKPHSDGGLARVGIYPPRSLRLNKVLPFVEGTPASLASVPLKGGDLVVAIDGEPVENYANFAARLVAAADRPLKFTVRRGDQELVSEVGPHPMRSVGLVMEFGKVVAVQENSPAAELDPPIKPGDFIERFSGDDSEAVGEASTSFDATVWDPATTPNRLRAMALAKSDVTLTVRRAANAVNESPKTHVVTVPLRKSDWLEAPMLGSDAIAAPTLGIAYRVVNRVQFVEPDSPAEKAGIKAGDMLRSVAYLYPPKVKDPPNPKPIELSEESRNTWVGLLNDLQWQPEGVKLKIAYQRGEKKAEVVVEPVLAQDRFFPERGFLFTPEERIRLATTLGEQVRRGWSETLTSLGMVYRFLSKLGTQIPLRALGGPITIVKSASYSATDGMGNFLIFLTMLSANLAVINFLPIPLLDGGHMAFLLYEGVRGKPAGERFVVALHTIGFVFIVGLMLFVLGLDFNLIERKL